LEQRFAQFLRVEPINFAEEERFVIGDAMRPVQHIVERLADFAGAEPPT
jgi:hypothetical protein